MDFGFSGIGVDWSTSMLLDYLVNVVSVLFVVGVGVLLWKMNTIRKGSREILAQRYNSEDILCHDNFADCFGMESFTGIKVRGNGVLVLSHSELYFLRLDKRTEICIPLKKITSCVTPSSFLGKSINQRLLKVEFQDEDGVSNAVAWHTKDLETFVTALKLQRKQNRPKKKN